MRCPYCGSLETQVKDSRPADDASAIRRRRICPDCGGRFTTFERVQLRELVVLKKSGRRVPFDREKLMRSLEIALRKRPVEPDRVERMVNEIVRQLESQGESEIPSDRIGELVMEGLRALDSIAYVRFASVYRNFREARDFNTLIDELANGARAMPWKTNQIPRRQKRVRRAKHDLRGHAVHGRGSRPWAARARALRAKPRGRRARCQRWRHRGARLDQAGRPPACGNRSPARGGRASPRRDALCDVGTMQPSWADAALHGCDYRGGGRPRGLCR